MASGGNRHALAHVQAWWSPRPWWRWSWVYATVRHVCHACGAVRGAMRTAAAAGMVLSVLWVGACSSLPTPSLTASPTSFTTPDPCSTPAERVPSRAQALLSVSAVVAANGVVYVSYQAYHPTDAYPPTAPLAYHVYSKAAALRGSDGAVLWAQPDPLGDSTTLAVAGDALLLGANSSLAAVRTRDGALLWQLGTATGVGVIYGDSLVVDGGVVYTASSNDVLYAVRTADGQQLWHVPPPTDRVILPGTDGFYPHLYGPVVSGGVVYVGTLNGPVVAVRASDGTPLWRSFVVPPATITGGVLQPLPRGVVPVGVAKGILYVASGPFTATTFPLVPVRPGDGSVAGSVPFPHLWPTGGGIWTYDAVVVNDTLYVSFILDIQGSSLGPYTYFLAVFGDGHQVVQTPIASGYPRTVAYDGGVLFVQAGERGGTLLAIHLPDGAVRWKRPIDGAALSADGGSLFVRQRGLVDRCNPGADVAPTVRSLSEADGSVRWEQQLT